MNRDKIICNLLFEDFTSNRKKLFTQAFQFANYGKVLYIIYNELNELPELSQDFSSLNKHTMKLISFMYVQSLESLIDSIATLPYWENVPSTIILDDLTSFCDKDNVQNACGIVALLINTVQNCSISLTTPSKVFVSINKNVVDEQYLNTLKELYIVNESMFRTGI